MYENQYPHLFSPIKLGGLLLKNRIFAAPTSQPDVNPGTYFKKENVAYYEAKAKGGAAVVSLGEAVVHSRTGLAHRHKVRLDDPAVVPSLSDAVRAVRQHGAYPSLELSHGGKYANVGNLVSNRFPSQVGGEKPYGPIHEFNPDGVEIFEMPEEIILEVIESFGRAAELAVKLCGVEIIMVHGGHGWLLHQFMSPRNTRTDRWGGSFENRMRLPCMVLQRVRQAVGPRVPIEFRFSGAEKMEGGYGVEYGVEIAKAVEDLVDLLHVSAGIHDVPEVFVVTHPDMFHEHGMNVHLAAEIKKHVKVPVATVGGLNNPAQMEEIIASGKADIVEVSRGLMADPELPNKAREGRSDEIVGCMRCFACMTNIPTTRNMRCALNPTIGRELELRSVAEKAPRAKKVLIAGGGPGGMKAAITAADRGHQVILCEVSDRLGGQINCEKHVPFKEDYYNFRNYLVRMVERRKDAIEVRLNTPVTPELARELAPDAILVAVGAKPIVPPIPGIDDPRVIFADELRKEQPSFGEKVVVIGGGLVGCETALWLAGEGKQVTVVEMAGDIAADAPVFHKIAVRKRLKELEVPVLLGTRAQAVRPEGLVCTGAEGEEKVFPADTIFCAAGMQARHDVVESLLNAAPQVIPIGDCAKAGQVFWAVSGGYFAALDL